MWQWIVFPVLGALSVITVCIALFAKQLTRIALWIRKNFRTTKTTIRQTWREE